jgi:hypothetical protein
MQRLSQKALVSAQAQIRPQKKTEKPSRSRK